MSKKLVEHQIDIDDIVGFHGASDETKEFLRMLTDHKKIWHSTGRARCLMCRSLLKAINRGLR